jgi:hypothetical protein
MGAATSALVGMVPKEDVAKINQTQRHMYEKERRV